MFLGLTNSADDIIRDRAVLQRERNLNVRLPYYVFAKTVSLGVFRPRPVHSLCPDRQLRSSRSAGCSGSTLAIMFMTAMSGVSLGLVISSLVADPKTAANIVPLVPHSADHHGWRADQYEDMNRNLGLVYTFARWFSEHPTTDENQKDGQQAAGAVRLRVRRHALVLHEETGRGPGEAESANETAGRRAAPDRRHRRAARKRTRRSKRSTT